MALYTRHLPLAQAPIGSSAIAGPDRLRERVTRP